jgi:hypothetical protein
MTDGVNNSGFIEPQTASDIAQQYGIKVYTIGIGSNGMAHKKIWNTTQKKTMIFQLFGHTKMAHKKDDFFGSKIHINRQKMFLK